MKLIFGGLSLLMLVSVRAGEPTTFRSDAAQTHLLELYTSEGCSSCPPAEKWMSQLKGHPRLWKEIVPVAFHVDYWNQLGWPDRFASKEFTDRQRTYAASWGSGTVYTPGFVLDGREWRGSAENISRPVGNPGVLSAVVGGRKVVDITFESAIAGAWDAHVAVIAFAVKSSVKKGENRGRNLIHDFVAVSHQVVTLLPQGEIARGSLTLPPVEKNLEIGLAVWVTETGSSRPVQATGGVL